jgi:hypothetical protein
MDLPYQQEPINTYSIKKVIILSILSICIIGFNIYLSNQFIGELKRFNLSGAEKQAFAIFSSIGLPLACLIISQIFIKWRGVKNGVKSTLIGSLIVLAGQVPVIFFLIK